MPPTKITSPRFIVSVNGEQRCVAGFDGYAVLSFSLAWRKLKRESPQNPGTWSDGMVVIQVGGLETGEIVDWLREVRARGDEITLRIGEHGPIDPPRRRVAFSSDYEDSETFFRLNPHNAAASEDALTSRISVTINGELQRTTGVTTGVLAHTVTWVRRNPADVGQDCSTDSPEEHEAGDVDIHVGGIDKNRHVDWLSAYLDVGDELTFRLLGPGPVDEPQKRYKSPDLPHADQLVAYTPNIILRRLVDDDLDFLVEMLRDPGVMHYWPAPLDRAGAEAWLRKQQQRYKEDNCGYWLILDAKSKEPVGQVGVLMTDVEGERLPCLGYMIHRPYWRKRYGIKAADACKHYAFERLDQPTVYTLVRPKNEPSIALARKLGMQPLRSVQHSGFEHILLSLTRPND